MERASEALAHMDYLTAEVQCLEALRTARATQRWSYYARILLPLQEVRRQRRMIAAEGMIRLGAAALEGDVADWLETLDAGCIVLTHPHTAEDADALEHAARQRRQYVEVLFADNAPDADPWVLRPFNGGDVRCEVSAPPRAWRDRWLDPGENVAPTGGATPADWFIDATEALGDAALTRVTAPLGDARRIEQLERMLHVVTDHEILHQRLGDAARAMRHPTA